MKNCSRIGRRTFMQHGATLAGWAALAACRAAKAAEGVTPAGALTMGLIRNPVSGLISLTEHKGWFKAAGLDFSSVMFAGAGGPKVIQAMGGGSVGLGSVSATAALLVLAAHAVPLRIISIATDPTPVFAILSAPDIDSMHALAGKKVATTAGTGLQYFLARALAKYGMRLTDVEFVNLPVGDAQAAFLAKRVDAVVPSLNGRYYIQGLRKDTRELFTDDQFTQPPGSTAAFEDYDVFVATQATLDTARPALRAFLAAYHGEGVPYLLNPGTQNDAIVEITHYVNAEQKSTTDEQAMRQQLLKSRFLTLPEARQVMNSEGFRAGLEDQVKFLVDTKQIATPVQVGAAIVSNLLA